MGQVVNIKIKINDNLKEVAVDAESLGKAIDEVTGKSDSLNTSIVRLGSVSQIAEAAASAFGQLTDLFKGLTDAAATQSIAETRLGQAMSNTMGATDAEVQSIKDLCSAQQRLGVIGDEVQLAAAQELATYLEYSDSLKAIIPVMNDMAAQQYGLGASAESVTQIATMLGKVMNGQTEALSRYGYKFDEAQKHILQYGTEAERAAVLVDVVSESVGGMNEALAQTPAGRMQQLANSFGDMKERLGQAVQSMMPFLSGFNTLAQGILTVTKLATAFKALANSTALAKVQSMAMAVAQKTQAAAARLLGVSETAAATATGVLKTQIIALQAAMTMGLSLAITGIIELISRLIGRSREATDAIGGTTDAVEEADEAYLAFRDTTRDAGSEINVYKAKLEDIIKHHKNDAQMVEELNGKYGESFGYYNDAATWYDILVAKSEAYCRQLGYEAQAKVIAAKKAEKEMELEAVRKKMKGMEKDGTAQEKHFGFVHNADNKIAGWGTEYRDTDAYAGLKGQDANLVKEISELDGQFQSCTDNMIAAQKELRSGMENTSVAAGWEEMSLAQLTKAIQEQKGVVESLAGVDEKQAAAESKLLRQMESRKKSLEGRYGLGSGSSGGKKSEFDGSKLIENATTYNELGNNIKYYQRELENTNLAEKSNIAVINQKIAALKAAQKAIEIIPVEDVEKKLKVKLKPDTGQTAQEFGSVLKDIQDDISAEIDSIIGPMGTGLDMELELTLATKVEGAEFAKQQIQTLQKMLAVATGDQKKAVQDAIGYWSQFSATQAETKTKGEGVAESLGAISSVVGTLTGEVEGSTAGWLAWASQVLASIGEAIPKLVSLATANTAVAATGAAASVANIPYVGWIMAGAAALGLAATLASIPKFADGGIAYGPTLGIFGEYAGASNNPEVVAPLDKLKDLLGTDSGSGTEKVEFSIRGDRLVALIDKRIRAIMRNG
jgi:hypothetical protein